MVRCRCLVVTPLVTALLLIIAIPLVGAATPSFTITDAYTEKAAYYIGESVTIKVVLEWSDLSQNYTLDIDLYELENGTKVLDLGSLTVPGAGGPASGSQELSYSSLSGLTSEAGTKEYEVRVIDTGSGLMVASRKLSITVAEASYALAVSWDDANDDRKIDVAESVTFTVYITWTFVNSSKSLALYVDDSGSKQLLDTVSVTVGSGSAQKMWTTAWNVAGARVVKFTLEDSERIVASKSVTVNVGSEETSAGQRASITDLFVKNIYVIVIIAACVIMAVIVAKYR